MRKDRKVQISKTKKLVQGMILLNDTDRDTLYPKVKQSYSLNTNKDIPFYQGTLRTLHTVSYHLGIDPEDPKYQDKAAASLLMTKDGITTLIACGVGDNSDEALSILKSQMGNGFKSLDIDKLIKIAKEKNRAVLITVEESE